MTTGNKLDIQQMIQLQSSVMGDKWLKAIKTEQGIATMVDMLDDHLAESMLKAYHCGLQKREEFKLIPVKK